MLNILSLISFANAVFFLYIAVYSIATEPKSTINQTSALECFLLAIWCFSYTFFYVAPTKEAAWFWLRLGSIGWSGFMGTLVWFFLALTRFRVTLPKYLKIFIIVILPIVLILLNFFSPISSAAVDLEPSTLGWGWTYLNHLSNPLYWCYILYILLGVFLCVYILNDWLKNVQSKHFKKLAIAFLGVDGLLILIGFVADLIVPMLTRAFPPLTNIALMIFSFSYWIIIFRLDLFKKTSIEASEFILDTIHDSLMVLDYNGIILHCNKATYELLQYKHSELVGKELSHFYKNNCYNSDNLVQLSLEKKLINKETDLVAKDGTVIHTMFSASIAEDAIHGFMGIIISFHDITQQKKLEKRLFELAHYDVLTGLPNRRYFLDMLYTYEELYKKQHKDFSILFMDLNGFKAVNDTMGHDKGDQLLIEIGRRITTCLQDEDILARIGGDEFVMLMTNIQGKEQIEAREALIKQQFETAIIIDNQICPTGVAIGYSLYSETQSISELMRLADQRMYAKKQHFHQKQN